MARNWDLWWWRLHWPGYCFRSSQEPRVLGQASKSFWLEEERVKKPPRTLFGSQEPWCLLRIAIRDTLSVVLQHRHTQVCCVFAAIWCLFVCLQLSLVFFVCLFVFFKTGFPCIAWLSWNSLCRPGWPPTQKSTCLLLPSDGITGLHNNCPPYSFLNKTVKSWKFVFLINSPRENMEGRVDHMRIFYSFLPLVTGVTGGLFWRKSLREFDILVFMCGGT